MQHSFWEKRWRQGKIGFHRDAVSPFLKKYISKIAPTPRRMLVPLCGKSLDLLHLAELGHHVMGVELSAIAARDFFEERGLGVTVTREGDFEIYRADDDALKLEIYCGDFFDLKAHHLAEVGGVWDRASLVALPTDLRARYVELLAGCLPVDAMYLLVAIEYDLPGKSGPPFSLNADILSDLFEGTFSITRLDTEGMNDADGSGYLDVPYVLDKL